MEFKHICSIALAFACLSAASPAMAQEPNKPQYGSWGIDLTAVDPNVKPGDDFNRYASGAWIARTQIPADEPMASILNQMSDVIERRLHALMERAAADVPAQPITLEQKVGAFYKAYMDEAKLDTLGATPIAAQLSAIHAAKTRQDIAELMGRNQTDFYGTSFALSMDVDQQETSRYATYVNQAGLGLPDRDYYLKPTFAAQKAAYQAYVTKLLTLVGWADPAASAAEVVHFETRLADASWTRTQQRDIGASYNPLTVKELLALAPGFAWQRFLDGAGLRGMDRLVVAEKSAFPRIVRVYQSTPLAVLQAWQAFTVADNAAYYLAKPFSEARFDFRDKVLAGQAEERVRWKRGVRAVSGGDSGLGERLDSFGNMGFGVGQLYTAQYFPPSSKIKIEDLVANVKAAMRVRLEGLDWMSPSTKTEALKKLDSYQIKVGFPDHARDYSGLTIRADDLVGDVQRCRAADWLFYTSRLHGPVDRTDWVMTPQTNDAYNGSLQDIVFGAGILQPPVFDPAADPAVNYGGIGATIGHELTHGFDDEGRKLDATGQQRDWWSKADANAFQAKAKRLGAQYSRYEPVPEVFINGSLTMGENIADLGGLNIALEAYHRSLDGKTPPVIDGFSGDQRVFLGWAQLCRSKAREDYIRKQVASDLHSPWSFRVIGPMRNVDAWYTAFGVIPGDTYYLAPDQRVRIW